MTSHLPTRKQVDRVLRSKKGGRHTDKRDDLDERIKNEQVRELIRNLRKRRGEAED